MRDTYVDIPDYGKNKINAAFAFGGPELVRKND
ncbi:LCP family protein [Lysinibacillus sp. MHQ-1]|nr:LCP family protein [Lysinibacillus sp. MHQ-1]